MGQADYGIVETSGRIEKDFLGEKTLPDSAYYGVQTLRGRNERIDERFPRREPSPADALPESEFSWESE